MAKVGTAHVEIKPVLNREALQDMCAQIEEAVAAAVSRGLTTPPPPRSNRGGFMRDDAVRVPTRN